MQYDLRNLGKAVLPAFKVGTSNTLLFPRAERLLAGMYLPGRREQLAAPGGSMELHPIGFVIKAANGLGNAAIQHLVFPGSWLIAPQPGYAYVLSGSKVHTSEHPVTNAPLTRERQSTLDEQQRTTVSSIQGLWMTGGGPDTTVFGLRRTAAAYVYGEIDPAAKAGILSVFGGEYAVNPEAWVDDRLLLVSENDPKRSSPRIVPLTYLTREFERWETREGTVIERFDSGDTN